jgi:thiol:disulfide interchange protein DsbD
MKIVYTIIAIITVSFCHAQGSWKFSVNPKEVVAGHDTYVKIEVTLSPGWGLFSSDFSAPIGPLPTSIELTPDSSFVLLGNMKPINALSALDRSFEVKYNYFKDKAEFLLPIRIKNSSFQVRGVIRGQYFLLVNHQVVDFEIPIDLSTAPAPLTLR